MATMDLGPQSSWTPNETFVELWTERGNIDGANIEGLGYGTHILPVTNV